MYYEFGRFRLDGQGKTLLRDGVEIALTPKLLQTLLALVRSNGELISKADLIRLVWPDTHVAESNLAVNISHLRKLLGKTEDGRECIQTVRKRGYRFCAEVREVAEENTGRTNGADDPADIQPPESNSASTTGDVPGSRWGKFRISARPLKSWSAVAAAFTLLAAGLVFLVRAYLQRQSPGVRSIAVLPFNNLKREPDADFLGFSLADAVITQLGTIRSLNVRPSASVIKYRNQVIDPQRVGAELNVANLLVGNFLRDGEELRLTAQLIDVAANRILWREVMNFKYDRLLTVQDQVVHQIITGMRLSLSPSETDDLKRNLPSNARAYELYLRGIDYYSNGSFRTARQTFEKSLELDRGFALAWAHLGRSESAGASSEFGGRENYEKASAAYTRALQIDPRQVEARVFLASLRTDTNRVEEAVRLLRDVLRQNPNHAEARWELGYAYRYAGMLPESSAECERARQLDPAVKIRYTALNSYLYQGQYEKFIQSLRPEDDLGFNLFYRGYAYYYMKDYARAAADFERADQLDRTCYSMLGLVLRAAIAGDAGNALQMLWDVRQQMARRNVCDPEVIYKVAQCYAVLGDRRAALVELERSIQGGFFCFPYLRTDPLLANVRNEPRYGLLLELARARHERFRSEFFPGRDQPAYASASYGR